MDKYVKKTVVIDAFQWTGNQEQIKVPEWLIEAINNGEIQVNSDDIENINMEIKALEGNRIVNKGDYIIKDIRGELYPCKPDIFEQTYEKINDNKSEKLVSITNLQSCFNNFLELIKIRKNELDNLIVYLQNNTTYFTAPASTKYHLNFKGGLLLHSVHVAEEMLKIKRILKPDITDESCVIVGLFHDLGKAGVDGEPYYLENKQQDQTGFPYIHNDKLVEMSVPLRSLYILLPRMPLSAEECQAIYCHDGQYVPENKFVACHEEPLTLIAQYADTWSSFYLEKNIR